MKKIVSFFMMILLLGIANAQTSEPIFTENMGTGATGNPSCTSYTGFQNHGTLVFTGDADVRSNQTSTGYTGASAGNNVYIASTVGRYFTISGINTSSYSDFELSFGFWKQGNAANTISSSQFVVEVATDYNPTTNTGTFTALSFPTVTTGSTWSLVTISDGTAIPSSPTLAIRFRQNQNAQQIRIDDVKLSGMVVQATCGLSEDFEAAVWAGANYTQRNVTTALGTWIVAGVGNMDANDHRNGSRSIRLRGNSGDNCRVEMSFDKSNGIGAASFAYASYSNHANGQISLYYSTNQGTTWTLAGSVTAPAWNGEMLTANFTLNIAGNVRIRIVRDGTLANSTSVNIDDICLTNYGTSVATVATPTFTPPEGIYYPTQNVTINCATAGATIHYTTDGTTPTTSSPVFSTPISVSATTTIKALAVNTGMINSEVATAVYTIVTSPTVPPGLVISGVYGGGGNSGSTYKNDYVELYNNTNAAINLEGYTLYYVSAIGTSAGATNTYTFPSGATIGAKKFALIKAAQGAGTQPEWPVLFDFDASGTGGGNFAMGASAGKVLLLSAYANLSATGSIPTTLAGIQTMANYVDYVPYGNTSVPVFGSPIADLSASTAAKRIYNDATQVIQYTFDVGVDFTIVTADADAPRNSLYGLSTATPTFTPPTGIYTAPINVTIACTTPGATIRYTTDGSNPTTSSPIYTTPINVTTTTTIKALATSTGLPNSSIATATYTFPIDVPDIAAFKAANPSTSTVPYRITGNVTFVYRNGRNIYIKDATAGLLIYDNTTPIITSTYTNGNVISGGVIGTCTLYNGLYELIPVVNTAAGTAGTPVQPIPLTMANLLANFNAYESQLVKLERVEFDAGTFGTGGAANLGIHQNGSDMICRNHFGTFTGFTPIATSRYDVSGFVIPFNADRQIAPRSESDITRSGYLITVLASPSNGGTVSGGGTYYYNETVTISATANTGYHFTQWNDGNTNASRTITVTENTTYTATFIPQYTLTLDASPVTVTPNIINVYANTAVGTLPTPVRPGYTFGGWFIGSTQITAATIWTYTSNQTATARWNAETYTLTFDPSTGTCGMASKPVTFNAAIGTLPTATQAGCTFIGWFIDGTQIFTTTTWTWTDNKTAIARFNYPITATNQNPTLGTISPTGTINYALGNNVDYVCTPNANAYIVDVKVNGDVVFTGTNGVTAPYTHHFTNIGQAYTIVVRFAVNCYPVNMGTITPGIVVTTSPTGCVPHGGNITYNISGACYDYEVFYGSTNLGSVTSHTVNNVTAPLEEFRVTGTIRQYTITASPEQGVDPHGYIEPGTTAVNCGTNITYDFHTTLGYRVATLVVDGNNITPIPVTRNYTFTNVNAPHNIEITFEEFPYFIIDFGPNASQNAGGVVFSEYLPSEEYFIAVDSGTVAFPFLIVPDAGYLIDKVFVDGVAIPQAAISGRYTFTNIRANHTITATFKAIMFTITATTDNHGVLMPGTIQVAQGANQTFMAVPVVGYELSELYVDGVLSVYDDVVGGVGFYTFEEVMTTHTIHATFAHITYEITATAGAHGTITPEGVVTVNHGDNATFTFTPAFGYQIEQVLIGGVNNPAAVLAGYYTFMNVTHNDDIHVTFKAQNYTITASCNTGGNMYPLGVSTVTYNEHSETYVFNPNPGYHVKKVLIDHVNNLMAIQQGEYRFLNVNANHTIQVFFAPDYHTVDASATQGGVITPAGLLELPDGTEKRFFFAPFTGYDLVRVMIDGINNPDAVAAGYYTFTDLSDSHIIVACFEKKTYTVSLPDEVGAHVTPVNGSVSPVAHGGKFMFVVDLEAEYNQSVITIRSNGLVIAPVGGVYTLNNIVVYQEVTIDGVAVNPPADGIVENGMNTIQVFSHQNIVTIKNEKLLPINHIDIMDMYGRIIWQGKTTAETTTIPLHVATGIYGVRIATETDAFMTKVSIIR